MGSWGKGRKKKSELCVAGENLLELQRTKGGEGGGSSCEGAPYSYWSTENGKWFFTTCTWLSQSGRESQCSWACQRRADSEAGSHGDSASSRRRSPQRTCSARTFCVTSCFLRRHTRIPLGSSMLGLCCLRRLNHVIQLTLRGDVYRRPQYMPHSLRMCLLSTTPMGRIRQKLT